MFFNKKFFLFLFLLLAVFKPSIVNAAIIVGDSFSSHTYEATIIPTSTPTVTTTTTTTPTTSELPRAGGIASTPTSIQEIKSKKCFLWWCW